MEDVDAVTLAFRNGDRVGLQFFEVFCHLHSRILSCGVKTGHLRILNGGRGGRKHGRLHIRLLGGLLRLLIHLQQDLHRGGADE